jgi:uncharacterized protein YecT (DUF1311 family)
MITSVLTALLFVSQLTINVADTVPTLHVEPTCRAESSAIDSNPQGCLQDEQDAKANLVKEWRQFHDADKNTCVGLSESGGNESYVELLTCLEMMTDARTSPTE